MSERSSGFGLAKHWRAGLRAGSLPLVLGVLAVVLAGCASSHAPTKGQRMIIEPARAAEAAGDYEKALRVYQRAAAGGVPIAQYQLARMYEKGRGTAQSDEEAARWYLAAAEGGYPEAQHALAGMYEKGRGVPKDLAQALAWYWKAAAYEQSAEARLQAPRRPAAALAKVGEMIERGQGTKADPAQAAEYYRLAADAGNPDAQYLLAGLYAKGNGVEQNQAAAEDLYRSAAAIYQARAAEGDISAQNRLGGMYLDGRGVGKDEARAISWLAQAADGGHTSAQARLAELYEKGVGEVAPNPAQAVRYYELAVASGHSGALYRLAAMYAGGKGVPSDPGRALELFGEGARRGSGGAAFRIAEAFERGLGMAPDPIEALSWYRIAHSLGDKNAAERVTRLTAQLDQAQVDQATAMAASWQREGAGPESRLAWFESKE